MILARVVGPGPEPGQFLADTMVSQKCQGCRMCASVASGETPKERRMSVWGNGLELHPGDLVQVESLAGRGMVAAFLLFGMPLLGFFGGLYGAPMLLSWAGQPLTEGYRLLVGVLGLGLSLGIVIAAYRFIGKSFFLMVVVEKASPEIQGNCSQTGEPQG